MRLRTCLVAVAAVAVASLAVPSGASAASTVTCQFSVPISFTPDFPPAPTTGGGSYDFRGDAALCTSTDPATGAIRTTTAHIESTGRYENHVCGTGRLSGSMYIGPPLAVEFGYGVDVVAWNGVMQGGAGGWSVSALLSASPTAHTTCLTGGDAFPLTIELEAVRS